MLGGYILTVCYFDFYIIFPVIALTVPLFLITKYTLKGIN